MLRSMYAYQKSAKLIDEKSTTSWNFLCDGKVVPTEYSVKKYVKDIDCFIPSIPYALDAKYTTSYKPENQSIQLKLGMHLMEIIDLKKLFKKLFSLPNFLKSLIHKELGRCS